MPSTDATAGAALERTDRTPLAVGAVLAASATLFEIVKWAGVLYMARSGYLRIRDARRGIVALESGPGFSIPTATWWFSSAFSRRRRR